MPKKIAVAIAPLQLANLACSVYYSHSRDGHGMAEVIEIVW